MGAEETRCQEEYEDAAGKQRIKALCAVGARDPGGWLGVMTEMYCLSIEVCLSNSLN